MSSRNIKQSMEIATCHSGGRKIHNWGGGLFTQRHQYKLFTSDDPEKRRKSLITPERISALESIGFEWVLIIHTEWEVRYGELKKYKAKYGDCNVPQRLEGKSAIGTLGLSRSGISTSFSRQMIQRRGKSRQITPERISALESIGFEWVLIIQTEWEVRYDELKKYKAKYGDCNVPQRWKENPQLGRWVSTQRDQYRLYQEGKKSPMTEERIQALEDIGFSWDAQEDIWQQRFNELKEYQRKIWRLQRADSSGAKTRS